MSYLLFKGWAFSAILFNAELSRQALANSLAGNSFNGYILSFSYGAD